MENSIQTMEEWENICYKTLAEILKEEDLDEVINKVGARGYLELSDIENNYTRVRILGKASFILSINSDSINTNKINRDEALTAAIKYGYQKGAMESIKNREDALNWQPIDGIPF